MNIIFNRPSLFHYIICLTFLVFVIVFPAEARKYNNITIKVEKNQSIRDISLKYLKNPDQWEALLRINGLSSPHEVKPGMSLLIPAEAAIHANDELESLRILIQRATKAGSKIFAPEIISKAIRLYNSAIEKRKSGEFIASINLAESSAVYTRKAIETSVANQDIPAEAVVQDLGGQVHRRKPADNIWKNALKFDILQEGEKIRTLSRSYAEIIFRDDSRLKLNENAQALIRRMRANLLENTDEATVSLIKGDVLALLSNRKKNNKFKLEVPGVTTKVESQHFWVGRDKKGARFANYDGKLEISSAGKKVVLSKNQGTIVPKNQKPLAPRDLLAAPSLIKPANGEKRFNTNTFLSWATVKGAESYLLEFSKNASFSKTIFSEKIFNTSRKLPKQLATGVFYWRVSAISPEQLPGRPSKVRYISVMKDEKPPFLVIRSPKDGAVFSVNMIEISGITEDRVSLSIMGTPVSISSGGWFKSKHKIITGKNTISVKATDPAGNVTELKRHIEYLPGSKIDLLFDDSLVFAGQNHFLVRQHAFSISGKTEPTSTISVIAPNSLTPVTATSDNSGRFQISLYIKEQRQEFGIEVSTLTGLMKQDHFVVEVDDIPPEISFAKEIPVATNDMSLPVSGIVNGAKNLKLNSESVALTDGKFNFQIKLQPGANTIRLTATDPVGNSTTAEKKIFLDLTAPSFLNSKLLMQKDGNKNTVKVHVWAKDSTGLVKTAAYTVQIGSFTHDGIMILSERGDRYTDIFSIPRSLKGIRKLKRVVLSDYLGNVREYVF